MKNRSVFSQVMLLIIVALCCIVITAVIAFCAGSTSTEFFDFRNLNLSNVVPVLIIGGFVSCVAVGMTVLLVSRTVFFKVKEYFTETNKKDGGNYK